MPTLLPVDPSHPESCQRWDCQRDDEGGADGKNGMVQRYGAILHGPNHPPPNKLGYPYDKPAHAWEPGSHKKKGEGSHRADQPPDEGRDEKDNQAVEPRANWIHPQTMVAAERNVCEARSTASEVEPWFTGLAHRLTPSATFRARRTPCREAASPPPSRLLDSTPMSLRRDWQAQRHVGRRQNADLASCRR